MVETASPSAAVSVLGSMLIDDRCVPVLMQQLSAEDFPDGELRHVFEAIQSLFMERKPVDPVTVLDRMGSPAYEKLLGRLMADTPTAANCEEYARILRDQRQLRQIQSACMAIVSDTSDLQEARALLAKAAALLSEKQADRDMSYTELISDYLDRQNDKTPPDLLDWGIPALNQRLLIGPGRFVILGADSSVGKTALALQFALSMARSKRVGFFSYETPLRDAADRLVANDADVSLSRGKARKLNAQEIARVSAAGERSDKLSLRIMETATFTVEDIRAKTLARGYQVIFVDYVQLIPTRQADRYQAVTQISIGLHALAQELGVTVIGLSQVTVPETDKKGNRRRITKEDLRESRQLKQDADAILLLDLADPKDRDSNRVLQVEKNRDGPLGRLVLSFDPHRMRFAYVPPVEDPDLAASRERVEKMDAKREERLQKEAERNKTAIDGQASFRDLADGEGGALPF